tara:strand:+ start:380 stop:1051 length:672 start_codon:yes stop_codon:yes gene_type:complete
MNNKKLNHVREEVISLVESENFDEVIKITNKILEDDPTSNFALFNKAFALEALNEYKLALEHYELLLEIHDKGRDNYDALYNKGLIHGKLGEFENAEKCFKEIIKNKPGDVDAWSMRGHALEILGETVLAISCKNHAEYLKNQKSTNKTNETNIKEKKPINTPYGKIKNELEAKNEFLSELVRTEDAKIKQALEKLHSRLDESDREKAYKWTAYYQGLVNGDD